MWKGLRFILAPVLLAIYLPAMAELSTFDAMVMPGEVIKGHAKIESQCTSCHVLFKKTAMQKACVTCHEHEDIGNDIGRNEGYHGRLRDKNCKKCHAEHKGRNADIVRLDKDAFDHKLTDFPLRGKHADRKKAECKECHKKGKKYSQAPSQCIACHKKDDEHKGSLGKQCGKCHNETDWKKTGFNHDGTDFPLRGGHKGVKCKACHKDEKFKKTPKTCYACHRKDDDHKGNFGRKCESCHTDIKWKRVHFSHDRDTRYPLLGKHEKVKCTACHKGKIEEENLKTDCYACHKSDDKHKGQLGKKCESCHTERGWKDALFDHDLSKFPLLGKHARTKCKECHKSPRFKDASSECYDCHKKKDEHKGTLGTKCGTCHTSRDWKHWRFDHNTQTSFKLENSHKGLACAACHNKPVRGRASLAGTCVSCHRDDDVHDGAFGVYCERCHYTTKFNRVKVRPGLN